MMESQKAETLRFASNDSNDLIVANRRSSKFCETVNSAIANVVRSQFFMLTFCKGRREHGCISDHGRGICRVHYHV